MDCSLQESRLLRKRPEENHGSDLTKLFACLLVFGRVEVSDTSLDAFEDRDTVDNDIDRVIEDE